MNENKQLDKRILAVLGDIIKRDSPTLTDAFVIEALLAKSDIIARVNHGILCVYGGLESGVNLIEFLKQYQSQIKKDMKNKGVN